MENCLQTAAAELLGLLARTEPPAPSLTVARDTGLDRTKAIISANTSLKRLLAEMSSHLTVLEFELKLLRQLLYKLHNRFRNDRGYKALRILEKSGNKKKIKSGFSVTIRHFLATRVFFRVAEPSDFWAAPAPAPSQKGRLRLRLPLRNPAKNT